MSQKEKFLDECKSYIDSDIFRLRPESHKKEYPIWPGSVGLEIEMLVIDPRSQPPRLVKIKSEGDDELTLPRVLKSLKGGVKYSYSQYDDTAMDRDDYLFKMELGKRDFLTFEPGGQLEFSSIPYPCLSDALDRMQEVQNELDALFTPLGLCRVQMGINPWHTKQEIGLQLSKGRYQAMDRYLTSLSDYGPQMMRQTCTVQVNLDFGDTPETLAMRYLAGHILAPFATAMFAYSPVYEGKLTNFKSYRSVAWRHLDSTRTGYGKLDRLLQDSSKAACVDSFFEFALDANVMFFQSLNFEVPTKTIRFRDWIESGYKGLTPTKDDFILHLTTLFPEVRPRGFIELRSVDAQAKAWQMIPAAFYTALLYDSHNLSVLIERYGHLIESLSDLLVDSAHGMDNDSLASISRDLMAMAIEGFERLPPCFQGVGTRKALGAFAERFTFSGKCPADELLLEYQKVGQILPSQIDQLENVWSQLIE